MSYAELERLAASKDARDADIVQAYLKIKQTVQRHRLAMVEGRLNDAAQFGARLQSNLQELRQAIKFYRRALHYLEMLDEDISRELMTPSLEDIEKQ